MPNPGDRLRAIKTFKQLVQYLGDELDWPVEEHDFDALTFEYSPEEMGLKEEDAAKVRAIHQLRPLQDGQPWGIFFVEFEKKRLPIVVLRRILSHLVVKKRASANKAHRAAWQLHDLLFISAFGSETTDQREIAFAHFHQENGDLPTLRVLGWDGADTGLKLDYVAEILHRKLKWPEHTDDSKSWREFWGGAFRHRIGHTIRTSDALAEVLAELARGIRDAARTLMAHESEKGSLTKLFKAFQTALIHDLTEETFADTYAQTITYGLLTAAIHRTELSEGRHGTALIADNITDMVPVTNPFLKEMLETFLKAGGRRGGIDFDELGIQDVVDLLRGDETDLPAILRDFGNRTQGEDPVIHFYEHFLSAYNKKLKVQRGVFYTPQPVVSYIVRSVHNLLQTEFAIKDGLASTITWGELSRRTPGLKIPAGTAADSPFVQILDPATGTATFLVEVIDVIHCTLTANWKNDGLSEAKRQEAWNNYVPKHLLPRLHGYELMMAPYAIAHMKIPLKLKETGFTAWSHLVEADRVRIYLTNALEPPGIDQKALEGIAPELAHEATAVNEIKRDRRFTVVVGNPPYNNRSENKTPWIMKLIEIYKESVRREETQIQALSDDYIKFLRLADWSIGLSGVGTIGMITNNGFLDGHIFRDLRRHFANTFNTVRLVNLHGDSRKKETTPEGTADQNVFDIMQGVSLTIVARNNTPIAEAPILYQDVWGPRQAKYQSLLTGLSDEAWLPIGRDAAVKMLVPIRSSTNDWDRAYPLAECFGTGNWIADKTYAYGSGFKSQQDEFAITFEKEALVANIETLLQPGMTESELRKRFSLCNTTQWNFGRARERLRRWNWRKAIQKVLFRPFDFRYTIVTGDVVTNPRREIMAQLERPNLGLLATRKATEGFSIFATRVPCGHKIVGNYDMTTVFPVYRYPVAEDPELPLGTESKNVNFSPIFLRRLAGELQLNLSDCVIPGLTPEDIFHYAYAVFHSPGFRSRYAEFLKIDFPRLPLTGKLEMFRALARLGGELTAFHLLESPKLDRHITEFVGGRNPEVEKISWSKNTVWVDRAQSTGFKGVREGVWNFHIGGYQVCQKWLKDRKGRVLSKDDIEHYQKIVVALSETIRLMKEIDEVIERHGGWPGAFQAKAN